MFVLSGFNLREKKTKLCAYVLLPDEKYETYYRLFSILKNTYYFEPKLINIDFSKSLTKPSMKLFLNV